MTTTIYFIRHAQPNYDNHDDMTRELSSKGLVDRKLVTEFLMDKKIKVTQILILSTLVLLLIFLFEFQRVKKFI